MRRCLGRPARLFNVPAAALESVAHIAGVGEKMRRMTRSLEIDSGDAERLPGWTAQVDLHAATEQMVRTYKESRQ